jgi:hypothetical protein
MSTTTEKAFTEAAVLLMDNLSPAQMVSMFVSQIVDLPRHEQEAKVKAWAVAGQRAVTDFHMRINGEAMAEAAAEAGLCGEA